jgi:hypothetical protein
VAVVTDFLDDIRGKAAGKQYAEAQIGRATLDEWLRDFTQNRDFGNETLLQFIDAVLERAQKDRQGE